MTENSFQMPFLTNSKQMMLEFIRKSNRVSSLSNFLHEFSTLQIQKLYMKVFNKMERDYLEKNWREQNSTYLLRTKYDTERLPENWFREND